MFAVVRRSRGLNGRWFDMSAVEHASERSAQEAARKTAEELCTIGTHGHELDVRSNGHTVMTLRWGGGTVRSIAWQFESILSRAS